MSCNICRVCLSADLKTYSLLNTPLQVIYEGLASYKLSTEDERPETACFICFSQLQTCLRFKEKSQKSEEILTQLFQSGIEILKETVAILNKEIKHEFSTTSTEIFYCPKTLAVKEEKATFDEETKQITNIQDTKTVQSEATLCRVCLSGSKTFPIRGTPLHTVYEKMTNTKLLIQRRPENVCCICRCQLSKIVQLVNKIKRSEKIIAELMRNGIQLSHETVMVLNSKIKPLLEVAPTESVSFFAFGQFCTVDLSKNNVLSKAFTLNEDEERKKQFEPFKLQHFKYECGVCKYTCLGLDIYRNHLKVHSVRRPYACDMCTKRFPGAPHLRVHKEAVHEIIYKCPKCTEKFMKKSDYNLHMNIHLKQVVYECDFCNKVFRNNRYLKKHNEMIHGGYKYKCDRCDYSFPTELRRKIHVIDIHGSEFPHYTCDLCRKQFKTRIELRKHMIRTHVETRKYKCDICFKLFKTKGTLDTHLKVHLEESYECGFCSKAFRHKPNLARHLKYHLNQKDFVCEVCAKRFVDRHALKVHSKVHTGERYKCQICNAEFYRKYYYEEHIEQHKNAFNKKYICKECGLMYQLESQLKMHMYRHKYGKKERKIETCTVCKKETKYLRNHMKIHEDLKQYKCDICDKAFNVSSHLLNHKRAHEGLKRFSCDQCGKFFATKSSLKVHISLHSSARPYKCDVCNATYSHKEKLSHHKRKHYKVNNFQCDKCGNKYTEKRSLDFHKRTHTNITKFICDYCYKVHLDKTDLIQHIKSHRKSKFKCENCKKTFGKLKSLAEHMRQHQKEKSVCPLCKAVTKRLNLRRHYNMLHNGVMPYACTVCEEGCCMIEKVYDHYMQIHSKEDRYVCELCKKAFTRRPHLREHMKNLHNR